MIFACEYAYRLPNHKAGACVDVLVTGGHLDKSRRGAQAGCIFGPWKSPSGAGLLAKLHRRHARLHHKLELYFATRPQPRDDVVGFVLSNGGPMLFLYTGVMVYCR